MNHENDVVRVEQVDDLKKPSSPSSPDDEQLVIADLLRKGRLGLQNDIFCFVGIYAVLGDMVAIPLDPPKLHGSLPSATQSHCTSVFSIH